VFSGVCNKDSSAAGVAGDAVFPSAGAPGFFNGAAACRSPQRELHQRIGGRLFITGGARWLLAGRHGRFLSSRRGRLLASRSFTQRIIRSRLGRRCCGFSVHQSGGGRLLLLCGWDCFRGGNEGRGRTSTSGGGGFSSAPSPLSALLAPDSEILARLLRSIADGRAGPLLRTYSLNQSAVRCLGSLKPCLTWTAASATIYPYSSAFFKSLCGVSALLTHVGQARNSTPADPGNRWLPRPSDACKHPGNYAKVGREHHGHTIVNAYCPARAEPGCKSPARPAAKQGAKLPRHERALLKDAWNRGRNWTPPRPFAPGPRQCPIC